MKRVATKMGPTFSVGAKLRGLTATWEVSRLAAVTQSSKKSKWYPERLSLQAKERSMTTPQRSSYMRRTLLFIGGRMGIFICRKDTGLA